jgi:diguanylate cyclase (GGDEF)-like protein
VGRVPHDLYRRATVGLAAVLLLLTAMSLVGVTSIWRSAAHVARSAALAGAYDDAQDAIDAQTSLIRQYQWEPSPTVLAAHTRAGAALVAALTNVRRLGNERDRALAARVISQHHRYDAVAERLFEAVDAHTLALTQPTAQSEAAWAVDQISDEVAAANQAHEAAQERAIAQLRTVDRLVVIATIAGLAVGLCLVLAFVALATSYHRDLLRQSRLNEHQAHHDAVTGLANRTLFVLRLTGALAEAQRGGHSVTVALFDLDQFKEVNDTLGHFYGDELLRQIAGRLCDVVRQDDTVARLGGDEFAILLPDADLTLAPSLAARVLGVVDDSFYLNDARVDVEASVGVAVAPAHGGVAEDLMRHADVAMYAAKVAKSGPVVYDPATPAQSPLRLLLLGDLRRALEQPDELTLHYQPKIDLQRGELCGVEALLRWQHPSRGLVSPAEFIPVVEETGLINLVTTRVLRLAISQSRAWLDRGLTIPVAVNLSARCLLDTGLPERVRELLRDSAVPPRLLRLEVTESAVMVDTELTIGVLRDLHRLGVRLSIDDYGTGYASMVYLKRIPVDELKIDRSFIEDVTYNPNDELLVRSAVDLGHSLGLTVVAEGVERREQAEVLRKLGCDVAQGYHFARPMPTDQFLSWLLERGVRGLAEDAPAILP